MLTLNQLKNNKWQSFWIIISSLLINILALSSAIYVIQVFNKYLTYKLDSTLIVLTIGVLIAFLLEIFLRFVRALLANKASVVGKRKLVLKNIMQAFTIKLGILDNKNEKRFFDKLYPSLQYYNTDESDRLISLIDIFFVIIFLLVIFLLSVKLGIVSSLFIFGYLLFIKLKNKNLVSLAEFKIKKLIMLIVFILILVI